jgi:hypothetical protein
MPADIAGRIDAALAAEALLDTKAPAYTEHEAEAEAEAQSASPVSRETTPETTPADSPAAPADRPSGHPRATTGPGRGSRTRTRRRRGAALGAVFTAAAIGLGVLLLQNGGSTPTGAPESGTPRQASSALSFSENKLENQVQSLLTEKSSAPSDSSTSKPSLDIEQSGPKTPRSNSPMRGKTIVVPDCIQRGTGRETPALAIERGDYKGTTAYLVVLPHQSDPAQVSAYVIDATCVKQPSSAPGKLLLTRSYARR